MLLTKTIRRKACLMDEIKDPVKVVPLVGDVKKMVPHPDDDHEFRGVALVGCAYAFFCYLALAIVFGICYGLAWLLQQGIHWIIN